MRAPVLRAADRALLAGLSRPLPRSAQYSWRYAKELVAGETSLDDWYGIEDGRACSPGICSFMGTAPTMTAIAEGLRMTMLGASSVPGRQRPSGKSGSWTSGACCELRQGPELLGRTHAYQDVTRVDHVFGRWIGDEGTVGSADGQHQGSGAVA